MTYSDESIMNDILEAEEPSNDNRSEFALLAVSKCLFNIMEKLK